MKKMGVAWAEGSGWSWSFKIVLVVIWPMEQQISLLPQLFEDIFVLWTGLAYSYTTYYYSRAKAHCSYLSILSYKY